MPRYLVSVEGQEFDIELEYRSEKYYAQLDKKEVELCSYRLGESRSLLLVDGQSFEVDVRSNGYDNRKVVFMKGQEISVEIEAYNLGQLRKTAGISSAATMEKLLRAPMPGLVLDVKVSAGQNITRDQPLVVVEAMKMENVIKAQGDGVIKALHVRSGASVEKGDKLLEFE